MSQKLLGLVGQGMRAQKPNKLLQQPFVFPPGSFIFVAPKAGYWKFVMWGHGGGSNAAANASGAYLEKTRFLARNEAVALVVGQFTGAAVDTKATFADGTVLTAGSAAATTPGAATGGDVNLSGSSAGSAGQGSGGGASGGAGGGAGAPGVLPFIGGSGGITGSSLGIGHGGGDGNGAGTEPGGLILAVYMRV